MAINTRKTANIFKALCDENRIKILQMLCSGEQCACKLLVALKVTQPTLSHHMKILVDSGIVVGRKEGTWMHYSISREGVTLVHQMLSEITNISYDTKENQSCH